MRGRRTHEDENIGVDADAPWSAAVPAAPEGGGRNAAETAALRAGPLPKGFQGRAE